MYAEEFESLLEEAFMAGYEDADNEYASSLLEQAFSEGYDDAVQVLQEKYGNGSMPEHRADFVKGALEYVPDKYKRDAARALVSNLGRNKYVKNKNKYANAILDNPDFKGVAGKQKLAKLGTEALKDGVKSVGLVQKIKHNDDWDDKDDYDRAVDKDARTVLRKTYKAMISPKYKEKSGFAHGLAKSISSLKRSNRREIRDAERSRKEWMAGLRKQNIEDMRSGKQAEDEKNQARVAAQLRKEAEATHKKFANTKDKGYETKSKNISSMVNMPAMKYLPAKLREKYLKVVGKFANT